MPNLKYNLPVSIMIILISTLAACKQMSELVTDDSAGFNGGFEKAQDGLPVNWLMYTPKTVIDGKFEILLDREIYKEGKQSLRFDIEACSSEGGLKSPGFTQQFNAIPGKQYEISFWTINDGTEYRVSAGGVHPMTGDMKVLVQTSSSNQEWQQYKFLTEVIEDDQQLRIEVNVLKPGTFWIDDIKIREIQ